ncbi:MAG: DUF2141 domain-containing protein [Crocinitomicaceae bacterium]|nr:DUF2141 domain-containing protein [Crocinitomicaceae bacterium]
MVRLISASLFLLGFTFSPGDGSQENTEKCTLSVEFTNIRNKNGKLYLFMYNYENQYPDNPYRYYEIDKKNISCNRLLVNVPNLEKGKYAISILDDENENEDMDFFLGIPTEGYAFSNNAKPFFSLPDFNEILFNLTDNHQQVKLKMRYVL